MIFNFFKSKPTLKEIIPSGFVDIHTHILPGIDDGAKDVNESLEMISEMKKLGFSKIIATPHIYPGLYNNSNKSIKKSYDLLKFNTSSSLNIEYAAEYMIDISIINKAEENLLLTFYKNYVLIETSYISMPINFYEIIYKIMLNNYIPVLAHPERYFYFSDDFKQYFKLKSLGCKFQLNMFSALGHYGKQVLINSDKLLKNKLIDYVGSDIHNQKHLDFFEKKLKIKNEGEFIKAMERNSIFL